MRRQRTCLRLLAWNACLIRRLVALRDHISAFRSAPRPWPGPLRVATDTPLRAATRMRVCQCVPHLLPRPPLLALCVDRRGQSAKAL